MPKTKVAAPEPDESSEETAGTEPEPKTYGEAEIKALLAKAHKEGVDETWQKYQGIQRTLNEKTEQIRELEAKAARRPSSQDIVLEEMKARERELGEPNPRIAALEATLRQERQLAEVERITEDARSKLVDKIVSAGFEPTDEKFDGVWDSFEIAYLRDGKFERADARLDRILAREKKPESKVESKEETDEERLRKMAEDRGWLKTETGEPSASGKGRTYTGADIREMSPTEWKKAFGNLEGFMKLYNEGKVKL